jgi:hypothetical protein
MAEEGVKLVEADAVLPMPAVRDPREGVTVCKHEQGANASCSGGNVPAIGDGWRLKGGSEVEGGFWLRGDDGAGHEEGIRQGDDDGARGGEVEVEDFREGVWRFRGGVPGDGGEVEG